MTLSKSLYVKLDDVSLLASRIGQSRIRSTEKTRFDSSIC